MTASKNQPAAATVEKIAAQLGAEPRWVSEIGPAAGLSGETVRRCLKVLESAGRAAKAEDGRWAATQPQEAPNEQAGGNTQQASSEPQSDAEGDQYDVALADAEWKALKDWKADGQKGDRPSTVNLDAMNAAHAAGKPRTGGSNGRGNGQPRESKLSERGREAAAESKRLNNHRGSGRKVSDVELDAYIRKIRQDHADARMRDEAQYAYWVERMAVGNKRFSAAWEAVVSGAPAPAPSEKLVVHDTPRTRKAIADAEARATKKAAKGEATVTELAKARNAGDRVKARREVRKGTR